MTRIAWIVGLCICGAWGCATRSRGIAAHSRSAEASSAAAPALGGAGQSGWSMAALPVASQPVAVKEGAAPLVYLDPDGQNLARQGIFQLTPPTHTRGRAAQSQSHSGGLDHEGGSYVDR